MNYLCENIYNYDIETLIKGVSKERLERTEGIKNDTVKLRSLFVEYLLNKLINNTYPDIVTPVTLTRDEKGKPHLYMPDAAGNTGTNEPLYISLSHSGDYAACMISNMPCGIDIEKHSDRSFEKIARRVCMESELSNITTAESFYRIWTVKESALKASGLGLSYDMRLIDTSNIIINEKKYAGTSLPAPAGYSMSYCEEIA